MNFTCFFLLFKTWLLEILLFLRGGGHAACGMLIPQPGIEPHSPQWKHVVLTTEPPGNSLEILNHTHDLHYISIEHCWIQRKREINQVAQGNGNGTINKRAKESGTVRKEDKLVFRKKMLLHRFIWEWNKKLYLTLPQISQTYLTIDCFSNNY